MKKKILVVDDEKEFTDATADALKNEGFQVFVSYDGKGGIEKYYDVEPDLVIIDLKMPNLTGDQALMTFRRVPSPRSQKTPVIVLSAFSEDESRRRTQRAEADIYLSKPVAISELLQNIKKLLK